MDRCAETSFTSTSGTPRCSTHCAKNQRRFFPDVSLNTRSKSCQSARRPRYWATSCVADRLPKQMKYHGGFLIADGVVALIVFLRELPKRIIALRRHVQVISAQHEPPLIPCLVMIARPLVPIVVGQIRRQAFNPISLLSTVEHGISDPGMHDLVTQGIGLNIVTLDHAAPEQGKGGHSQATGKKVLHH